MIGRVAGTIAGWGRRARLLRQRARTPRAFEHELTHILLHQMAAFNSPVWFNVGFEEQPQCSACLPSASSTSAPSAISAITSGVRSRSRGRARGGRRGAVVRRCGGAPVVVGVVAAGAAGAVCVVTGGVVTGGAVVARRVARRGAAGRAFVRLDASAVAALVRRDALDHRRAQRRHDVADVRRDPSHRRLQLRLA